MSERDTPQPGGDDVRRYFEVQTIVPEPLPPIECILPTLIQEVAPPPICPELLKSETARHKIRNSRVVSIELTRIYECRGEVTAREAMLAAALSPVTDPQARPN
jgi:hypothetical protein